MSKKIYLDDPNIGDLEKDYLNRAVDSTYVSTAGPFVSEFENRFAKVLNAGGAVSVQSGTAAIHIALYEMGIGKDDEVIVPALTFSATVNPILYVRARPVFVDVDIKTWNIDPERIERAVSERTKAILPVHLYGNPCNMEEIMNIARKYNIRVIEDATESLGALFRDRFTGTFGDMGCFSFNGNKLITTGGGGMVLGNDKKRLEHIKFLVNQARDEAGGYYHPEMGFNYRMTNLEAAMGLAQMERLDEFLRKKQRYNMLYRQGLKDVPSLRFQEAYEGAESSWWLSCILLESGADISGLQKALKERGVPSRRVFMPVTEFPYFKGYKRMDLVNSYEIFERGLCLPSSTLNSDDEVYHACATIRELLS